MRAAGALDLPLTYTAQLNGRPVSYRLVVSRRAKAWRLSIHPHTGLSVVVPAGSRLDVEQLLHSHAGWIRRWLDRLTRLPPPRTGPLTHGSSLPYLGGLLRLEVAPAAGMTASLDTDARILRIGPAGARELRAGVQAWYRQHAGVLVRERIGVVNAALGYRFGRVTIRDQKSRWGSCSAEGHLSFNWRLIMAPLAIVDSVVAHELTHLVDRTHAPSFWRRLSAVDPAYDVHRRWLREHGAWLTLDAVPPPPGLP